MSIELDMINRKRKADRAWGWVFDLFVLAFPIALVAAAFGSGDEGRDFLRASLVALPATLYLTRDPRKAGLKFLLGFQFFWTVVMWLVFASPGAGDVGWYERVIDFYARETGSARLAASRSEWLAYPLRGALAFGAAALVFLLPLKLIFQRLFGTWRKMALAVVRVAAFGGLFGLLWAGSRLLF